MKLPIAAAILFCMLGLAGCSQMNSRLARPLTPTATPMSFPDMSPGQPVGIAQPLPPITGVGTSLASSPEPLYNISDTKLDLSVKSEDSMQVDVPTPVRKSAKKTSSAVKVAGTESPASKTEAAIETSTVSPDDVDTSMLAQPVRKGSSRKAGSKSSRISDEEKGAGSPQSNNNKSVGSGKDIIPVSNPASAEKVDSRQFS